MDTLELLDLFSSSRSLGSILDEYDLGEGGPEVIQDLVVCHHLNLRGFDERKFLGQIQLQRLSSMTDGSLIDRIELIMTEECNFRCAYCLHFDGPRTSGQTGNRAKFMTFDLAKTALDAYFAILRRHHRKMAIINFGGGEPLLAWPTIERLLKYCRSTYGEEFKLDLSINTNASLVTRSIARKIREYGVAVASSLDGPRTNDLTRRTKAGRGTCRLITRGLRRLKDEGAPVNVAVTVTDENLSQIDETVVDWVVEWGMKEIRINPDSIHSLRVEAEELTGRLMRLRRYGRECGVEVSGSWSRAFENLSRSVLDEPVAFCASLKGKSVCVNPAGEIYACGYSARQLGTVGQIDDYCASPGPYCCFVRGHLIGRTKRCQGCEIEGQCGGGCEITRESAKTAGSGRVEQLCDLYRRATRELILEQLQE